MASVNQNVYWSASTYVSSICIIQNGPQIFLTQSPLFECFYIVHINVWSPCITVFLTQSPLFESFYIVHTNVWSPHSPHGPHSPHIWMDRHMKYVIIVFIIIKINESLYILVMTRGGKHSLFQKLVAKTHARPLLLKILTLQIVL